MFALFGCNKYPDGNNFSIYTAFHRTVGVYRLDKYLINGIDSTASLPLPNNSMYSWYNVGLSKTGAANCYDVLCTFNGCWQLESGRRNLNIRATANDTNFRNIFFSDNSGVSWRIQKLTNKDLWLKINRNNTDYEIHLHKYMHY